MNILILTNHRLVEYKDGRIEIIQHSAQSVIETEDRVELIKFLKPQP